MSGLFPGSRLQAPIPVVFLLEDLDFGGTQGQTLELASRLDPNRFRAKIVTLRGSSGGFGAKARCLGLECVSLTQGAAFNPALALPRLYRYLATERPPLVQLVTALPNIWGRIIGSCLGLPGVIACCRGVSAIRSQHERLLKGLAAVHIGNAEVICRLLIQKAHLAPERVFFIPNGVDVDFFSPPDQRPAAANLLCVARMEAVKNHALLLKSFARVLDGFPDAELHLVGDGKLKADMQKRAAAPDLRGRVRFHPGSADLRPLLRAAQVLVLASDSEGTPNVLLEAMACGVPVVATRVGGNEELVLDGRTGLLTPPGDPERLAGAMLRLLERPDERAAFGKAGRERVVNEYSLQRMVRAHEQVYDFVLRGRA